MTTAVAVFDHIKEAGRRGFGAPLIVMLALAMMMLPLPTFLLDVLFSFNIALSLVIVLAVVYVAEAARFLRVPDDRADGDAAAACAQRRLDARRAGERPRAATQRPARSSRRSARS